jgi:LAO/AO transport system kinase
MGVVDDVLAGQVRGIAKALSIVERGGPEAELLLGGLRGSPGTGRTIGVTGAPGAGKSTLVQALGLQLLGRQQRVAVLAVDPSSPFTGDRVRMPELVLAGGFVRSMATRGALGGLTAATADAIDVLLAAGFDWVLVETVGVGQDEVDVAGEVETVVVVTTGGMGDDVQAAKAGVMEIADIFAVNKADQPGAEMQVIALEAMLAMAPSLEWAPPIVKASAINREGIAELIEAIEEHQRFLDDGDRRKTLREQRAARRIERVLQALVLNLVHSQQTSFRAAVDGLCSGHVDPYAVARQLFASLTKERT